MSRCRTAVSHDAGTPVLTVCSPQMGLSATSHLGGEVYDYQILRHLADLGVEWRIILPKGCCCGTIARADVSYVPLRRGRYANWVFARAALREFDRRPFDLLRLHSMRYLGLAGLAFRARHRQIPIVATHLHLTSSPLDRALTRIVAHYADALIAISRFSASQLVHDLHVDAGKVHIVYCGVASSHRSEKQVPADLDVAWLGEPVILTLGTLTRRKNVDFLLSIFPLISARVPKARLVVGGDGEERQRLEKLAGELGIRERVHFVGVLGEGEKRAWLSAASVVVSASQMEGFGLSIAEAMASGKPVVVSAAGSLPEIVEDGITGYVVPLADRQGFADAVVRLLQNPSLRKRMGAWGIKHVRVRFTWEAAATRILAVYRESVEKYRG